MKKLIIIYFFSIFTSLAVSQTVKYGNDFLQIGAGARERAMGGNACSSVGGAVAGYVNPALMLNALTSIDLVLLHENYFASMADYDFGAVSYKPDTVSAFGFSFLRFGVDDIQNTLDLMDQNGNIDYSRISYFSTADYAFLFSFARQLPFRGFSAGANVKIIYRHQGDFASAYGFGLDLAAHYQKGNFSACIMMRDITGTFDFWNVNSDKFDSVFVATGNSVPENSVEITAPSVNISASYIFYIRSFSILAELGLSSWFDGKRSVLISSDFVSANPNAGIELSYNQLCFLRMGISDFQINREATMSNSFSCVPSVGAGLQFKRWSVDYTFAAANKNTYDYKCNLFSFRLKLGKM